MAQSKHALFIPVLLQIDKQEHVKRLSNPNRLQRWKSIDPAHAESKDPLITITHKHLLTLDVTSLSPQQAAKKITSHVLECTKKDECETPKT